jgi:hypothetical protein
LYTYERWHHRYDVLSGPENVILHFPSRAEAALVVDHLNNPRTEKGAYWYENAVHNGKNAFAVLTHDDEVVCAVKTEAEAKLLTGHLNR